MKQRSPQSLDYLRDLKIGETVFYHGSPSMAGATLQQLRETTGQNYTYRIVKGRALFERISATDYLPNSKKGTCPRVGYADRIMPLISHSEED